MPKPCDVICAAINPMGLCVPFYHISHSGTEWSDCFTALYTRRSFCGILKHVEAEMIAGVIPPVHWKKVVPVPIVGRHPHIRRIPMIQVRCTAEVFRRQKIVRIIYVGIMIEPLPILCIGSCPLLIESLLCRSRMRHQK